MFTLTLNKKTVHFSTPIVMGILNATPDSFFNKSRMKTIDEGLFAAEKMINDGATIIDIGGQSTRPNSDVVDEEEELKRVLPVIASVKEHFPESYISIDTYYSNLAKQCVEAGATIVNDISGGSFDKEMIATVASLQVPYVCMHVKGNKETMHSSFDYTNIIQDVKNYFTDKINTTSALNLNEIILDIGFGFSKSIEENFKLIKHLHEFKSLHKPLLVGVSRKSSIYKTLGVTPNEALNGTTVLHTLAVQNGAAILRAHDVKEAKEVIKLYEMMKSV